MIPDMFVLLEQRNRRLAAEVDNLASLLGAAMIPSELEPYRQLTLLACKEARRRVGLSLQHLALRQEDLIEDVLSDTQIAILLVRRISSRLSIPVLRGAESDRLCLRLIAWLHSAHPETAHFPAAVADGDFAVLPMSVVSPLYYFPSLEQRGLLYQPLQFHEFGHVLYACHEQEMNDLVAELQRRVARVLTPISGRNDRYAEDRLMLRQVIINTWYRWILEIFCDAVGFTIGGPCFVQAFASYLSNLHRHDFYQCRSMLASGAHPVTWLRVQLLAQRAADAGFGDVAEAVDREWRGVARVLQVEEDYHGFYDPRLLDGVLSTLEDMLVEAAPRAFEGDEISGSEWPSTGSPVWLLNRAWQMFGSDPNGYADWEHDAIRAYLSESRDPLSSTLSICR